MRIFSYLKKYKGKLFLSLLFNALAALFTLVSIPFIIPFFQILFNVNISGYTMPESGTGLEAYLTYYFSRLIAISDKTTALGFVCILLVVIVLFRNIFRYLAVFFQTPLRNGIIRDLRFTLVQSFLNMPMKERRKTSAGNLLSISSHDVVEVEWSVIRMLELLIKSPILIIGSLLIMFSLNVKLSLISLLLLLIVGGIMGLLSRNLKAKSAKTQSLLAILHEKIEEIVSSIKMIKVYGAERFFLGRFSTTNEDHYNQNNRILWRRDLSSPLSEFLGVTVVVILIWYGARMVIFQEMKPEIFFAFIFAFYNVIEPLKSLSTAYYHVQKGNAALDRIEQFLAVSKNSELSSGQLMTPTDWNSLKMENVRYDYGSEEVLSDVSLTIQRGQSIAIVGKSGAGKSTLIDLLMRIGDPAEGNVTLDDMNIRQFDLRSYRKLFGYISQVPILFEGTIAENVAFNDQVNREALSQSLVDAEAIAFSKIKGASSTLSEKGDNYSLGQKQRLAIARALYHDRDILILDEGTTALDAESEQLVLRSIEKISEVKTLIIISHKFNLIKNVDQIYVIDDGKVVNTGTHDELISENSLYKELLSYQEG